MSLMPTSPGSIGSVLDRAIRLYGRSILPCIPIVLVIVVLIAVPSVLLALAMQTLDTTDPLAVFTVLLSPVVLFSYLGLIIVSVALYGALFAKINAIAHGESLTTGEALGIGLRRAPTMLGVTLLFSLMIAVGFALLLIPGIWLWGIFQLAFVAVIVERTGVFESFGTSRRLIKGNWWRANVIVFVAAVIMVVLLTVVSVIAGIIVAVWVGASGTTGDPLAAATTLQVIQQIISGVLNLFTMTFFPCVLLSVYHDLKLRREGSDLAGRVGALNPAV